MASGPYVSLQRNNMIRSLIIATWMCLLTGTLAKAEVTSFWQKEGSDSISSMHEVEVAAHRLMKDAGIQKTTIDSAMLHENLAYSMSDILTKHSTLFIKSYGRATESTAEFRGTSPSHTQVTWNGMRINSPMLGTVDFSYIPAYFVDEATLLHGPSSVTLTDGGLGGAIELSTRPNFTQENGKWGVQYTQGIGSFHTYDQFLRLQYANERWSSSTRLSYGHSKNNFPYTNYDKKVDERNELGQIIHSYHPTEHNKSGYFDDINLMQDVYFRDLHGNRLAAMLWYGYSLRGLPFLSVDYKDDSNFTNEHKQQNLRSLVSWDHTTSRCNLSVKAGYTYQGIAYDYSTTRQETSTDITHSRSYSQTGHLQACLDYQPTDGLFLNVQTSVNYNQVRSWDRSPFHIGQNYDLGRMEEHFAVSAKWRPTQLLTIHAMLRDAVYKNDVTAPIPALFIDYVLYKPWNLVLKASTTRNYRYPTMDDLYYQPGGNASLKPERGFSYDGGVEFSLRKRNWSCKGNLSAFDSYINDWILWTPNTKGYWQPSNVKKVHNYGFEAMLQATWQPHKDWLIDVSANAAYTPSINKGERVNSNDASYGKQLCYVPLRSANLAASLHYRTWSLTYQWVHYSERSTTTSNEVGYITGRLLPYYMSDISLEKMFKLRRVTLSIKGVVSNLLGSEYVTVLSHPMAGRSFEVFAELKY